MAAGEQLFISWRGGGGRERFPKRADGNYHNVDVNLYEWVYSIQSVQWNH